MHVAWAASAQSRRGRPLPVPPCRLAGAAAPTSSCRTAPASTSTSAPTPSTRRRSATRSTTSSSTTRRGSGSSRASSSRPSSASPRSRSAAPSTSSRTTPTRPATATAATRTTAPAAHDDLGHYAEVLIPFLVSRQIFAGAGKVLQTARGADVLDRPAGRAHLGGRQLGDHPQPADHQHPRRAARRRRALPPAARHRRRLQHERVHDLPQGRLGGVHAADARGPRPSCCAT